MSTDGLTVLARIHLGTLLTILKHFTHTMKPSDPLLLADVTLRCGMYPAGKVDISQHLAIPGFPQSDHTVGKPSADAGGLSRDSLTFSCLFPLFAHLFIVRQETVKNIQDGDLYRFVEVTGELYNWKFLLLYFNRQISVTC